MMTNTTYPRTVTAVGSHFDQGDLSWLLQEGEVITKTEYPGTRDEWMKHYEYDVIVTIDLMSKVIAPPMPSATFADIMPAELLG